MRRTTCAKANHADLNELCAFDEQNVEFVNCNATVDVAPWRFENPEANLQCEPGALQMNTYSRRRPPGWTPLRHFLFEVPSSNGPHSVKPVRPVKPPKPVKPADPKTAVKESSEEDATAPKPTGAAKAAEAANDRPFHCPSKPWKPFHPVHPFMPGAHRKPVAEVATPPPSVDGALKDSDLVA
ncbi:hypothetical protein Q5P01_015658 [Channa striata]|uniref:Uncharacterized protein n=1 Tax=Channa striata TaxID=64152 RepID=A0AA88MDP4_CHASR|nr:hypothetical protein Q5P01_015658 [Channa striata]